MDNVILTEAFKELKLLEEEAFDINSAEELEDAKEFLQDDNAEPVVEIADVYAEEEGELLDSYVGKVILECEVCHSKIFEDADKVTIDEEENVANMDQECPFCFSNDGYKVIGQVAPFGQVEEEIAVEDEIEEPLGDEMEEPVEEVKEEEEIVNESLNEEVIPSDQDIIDFVENTFYFFWRNSRAVGRVPKEGSKAYKRDWKDIRELAITKASRKFGLPEEQIEEICKGSLINNESLTEDDECIDEGCMKKGDCKNNALDECGDQIIEEVCPECGKNPCECEKELTEAYVISTWGQVDEDPKEFAREYNLKIEKIGHYLDETTYKFSGSREDLEKAKADGYFYSDDERILEEDFKDVSITTDDSHMTMTSDEDGKITVTTEPVQEEAIEDEIIEDEVGDEMIAPVDDETVAEIEGEVEEEPIEDEEPAEDEEVDVDFDEFDEEGFDDLGESYLKKVYENVNSFKTTGVIEKGNNIIIEGLIEFDSGNKKKTSFILEARDINDKGTIRFIGENKEITKGKKAFTVLGRMNDKKFMCEALRYHYMTKNDEGTSTRVNGTIRRDK